MHRARTRVLVPPEWASNNEIEPAHSNKSQPSLLERVSQLVSVRAVSQAEDRKPAACETAKASDACLQQLPTQPGVNAPAPSPGPEPASSASAPQQVLYPPPVPPYAPVRSTWPEAALVDLIKQQALFPTDVNLHVGSPCHLAEAMPARSRGLLHAISEEAQTDITASPASASFQFVQLFAELCGRATAGGGGGGGGSMAGAGVLGPAPRGDPVGLPGRLQTVSPAGPAPPPFLAPSPAQAAAAAACGRGLAPQLEAIPLGAPAALVGFQGDWLAVQPAVLPCWDKVSLEPCGPLKAAEYYVVCAEQYASAARMFIKDVSATFLAMRLGTHQAARTPAHLYVMDGVIPVPMDPGPGPPAADGGAAAAAAAVAVAADPTASSAATSTAWNNPVRRADPSVQRSAVLGFRSNHATTSAVGELGWAHDEPCYLPRSVPLLQRQALAVAAGAAMGMGAGSGVGAGDNSSCHYHYWRNLRHVARQLQRDLLLQPPGLQQQQQQRQQRQRLQRAGGVAATLASSAAAAGTAAQRPCPAADESLGLGPLALVVYVVPPSDSPDDVARALMEVCACLAPVTPAARTAPAPAPLAQRAPTPTTAATATATAATAEDGAARAAQWQGQGGEQQPGGVPAERRAGMSPQGTGPLAAPLVDCPAGAAVGAGAGLARSSSFAGTGARVSGGTGAGAVPGAGWPLPQKGAGAAAAAGFNACSSGRAASTPPEAPASCFAGSNGAIGGGGGSSIADAGDPALIAKLGGAARFLYRTVSCPAVTVGSKGTLAAADLSPQLDLLQLPTTNLTVQIILPSALHDVTGASVRATACAAYSKLVRRPAAYGTAAVWASDSVSGTSALLGPWNQHRDQLAPLASSLAQSHAKPTLQHQAPAPPSQQQQRQQHQQQLGHRHHQRPQQQHASSLGTNLYDQAATEDCRADDSAGGTAGGGCVVVTSCSGRSPLYEPLVSLAPSSVIVPGPGSEDGERLLLPPPSFPPPPPPPPPLPASSLRDGGAGASSPGRPGPSLDSAPTSHSLASPGRGQHHYQQQQQLSPSRQHPQQHHPPQHGAEGVIRDDVGAVAAGPQHQPPQRPPPTLHCCYAWRRCHSSSSCSSSCSDAEAWLALRRRHSTSASASAAAAAEALPVSRRRQASRPSPGAPHAPPDAPQPLHRHAHSQAWLAMAFCDVGGRLLDVRALALCSGDQPRPPEASCRCTPADASCDMRNDERQSGPCSCRRRRRSDGGSCDGGSCAAAPVAPTDNCPSRHPGPPLEAAATASLLSLSSASSSLPPPCTAAAGSCSLDALVCRAVLGHARLLQQQLYDMNGGGGGGAPAAAPAADGPGSAPSRVRSGGDGGGVVAVTKLGPPTPAEAAEWRALLADMVTPPSPPGAAAAPTAAADEGGTACAAPAAVTLAWLEAHPTVAAHPGCRLPQGGFVVSHSHAHMPQPQQQCGDSSGGGGGSGGWPGELRSPLTLLVFPSQQPPSATCAAAEALNRHLRMLSIHPWPLPPVPPQPPQPPQTRSPQQPQQIALQPAAVAARRSEPEPAGQQQQQRDQKQLPLLLQHNGCSGTPTGAAPLLANGITAMARKRSAGDPPPGESRGGEDGDEGPGCEGKGPAATSAAAAAPAAAVPLVAAAVGADPSPPVRPASQKRSRWGERVDIASNASANAGAGAGVAGSTNTRASGAVSGAGTQPSGADGQNQSRGGAATTAGASPAATVAGAKADSGCTMLGAAAAVEATGDTCWASCRQLYGLCVLRDCLLAAQSGARGGPAPGRRLAGGGEDDGDQPMALLPLHAAVCQQLLRILTVCDRLALAAS